MDKDELFDKNTHPILFFDEFKVGKIYKVQLKKFNTPKKVEVIKTGQYETYRRNYLVYRGQTSYDYPEFQHLNKEKDWDIYFSEKVFRRAVNNTVPDYLIERIQKENLDTILTFLRKNQKNFIIKNIQMFDDVEKEIKEDLEKVEELEL